MISPFRVACADLAETGSLPVVRTIPDDIAHVPCVVIGRVRGEPGENPAAEELSTEIYVIGRRQRADDPVAVNGELDHHCDEIYSIFGATRGTTHGGWTLVAGPREPSVIQIAGLDHEAYQITVRASHVTHIT